MSEIIAGGPDRAFSFMVDHVADYAIFLLDVKGIVLTWNKASEKMKGYVAEEITGRFFGELYIDDDRRRGHPQHNLEMAAQHGTYQEETWRQKKDGSLFWALVEIIAIKSPAGELTGFCKLTRDITAAKVLQDHIAAEKERAEVTLRAIGDGVISTDVNGNIASLNPKAEQLTGWKAAEAIGRPFWDIFHVVDEATLRPQEHELTAMLKHGTSAPVQSPVILQSRDGSEYAIEDAVAPIRLSDGRTTGGVIVFRDVTQSRRTLNAVTHQATHDALTGLVNRTEFEHRLARSLARSQQSHAPGVVLFMDLDNFKIVNDTCGHEAGDALLKQLSALYSDEIRDRDTLARVGGDEFMLIADHCTQQEALAIADKILHSTRDFQFVYADRVFQVGVSIGLTTFDEHSGSVAEIVRRADSACYIAKRSGRNQVHCLASDEMDIRLRKPDLDWVTRLTEAMELNQLQLHYQPIATVKGDDSSFRFEVLLRLMDPQGGIVMPGVFLPAAERYNLLPIIDRWVVHRVAQWLDANREHALQVDLCAINLSGKTLADKRFLRDLPVILGEYNIATDKLCFEITEAAAVIDIRRSLIMINGLREMGCKVCLASFGMGTGSFANLKQLPADFIKIDGSFVAVITDSIVDEKMITLVHEIAHLTGKKTIAEWVENEATAEALSRIGVDYLQGNWIAYPMQLDERFRGLH